MLILSVLAHPEKIKKINFFLDIKIFLLYISSDQCNSFSPDCCPKIMVKPSVSPSAGLFCNHTMFGENDG